jgi:hypothetical protein
LRTLNFKKKQKLFLDSEKPSIEFLFVGFNKLPDHGRTPLGISDSLATMTSTTKTAEELGYKLVFFSIYPPNLIF